MSYVEGDGKKQVTPRALLLVDLDDHRLRPAATRQRNHHELRYENGPEVRCKPIMTRYAQMFLVGRGQLTRDLYKFST